MTDKQLGKFQIIEEIGHGGFGTVYRANDTTLDRVVALKILHEQYLSDQKFIESFKREARMMARVSHPNVVQIFEVGDLESQIYIAMQYFDGGSLEQKIQSGGPLPLKDAIRMLSQTARGLEAGHKIGLVHRDVKPANILYNREGYIAISDFGVAKSIQQSSPETTNSFNQFAGTPNYIPPELWQTDGNPSPAADVYSLACVFYEALTTEVLFAGETYEHVLTRHVLEAPIFSQALPECLVDTLNVALAKNPSDRFQTMNDFLAAVRGALERQGRKPAGTAALQEPANVINELPKPLAPGEITFDELVRRSQRKTTGQSPVTKPVPISQPTPSLVRPSAPTQQPQIQKTEPKQEPPVVVPIILPPQPKEQAPEPIVEESPASTAPTIAPEASLPQGVAELPEGPNVLGFSEGESVEDFFARTLDEPLETEQKALPEVEETPNPEEPEEDLLLDEWLTKEPSAEAPLLVEPPVTHAEEDTPLQMEEEVITEEEVSGELAAEAELIPLVEKIVGEIQVGTLAEAEPVIPVEQDHIHPADKPGFQDDQSKLAQEIIAIPASQTQVDKKAVEDALLEIPVEEGAIAGASASQAFSSESKPEDDVVVEPTPEMPKEAQSIAPTEDRLTKTLKERQDLLAHNAATSKFDQPRDRVESRESKRKPKFILLLSIGGIALIALAFLVFSGQARNLFGGKPGSTPTLTLTLLPSNTVVAPVIIPTHTNTATSAPSSTSQSTQTSPHIATIQSPTLTAPPTSTPYPTARATNQPTNPPNLPTATYAPPTKTSAPPTVAPPTSTIAPPTSAPPTATIPQPTVAPLTPTVPPANTPVPTRGPTPTPP